MKHLMNWKIFENLGQGNASFNWLKKHNNLSFQKLEDILQMEIFDKFNIVPKGDEHSVEEGGDWSTDKFWTYRVKASKSVIEDTSNFEEISEGKEIDYIIIYNINHEEHEKLVEVLESIKERVKSYIGKELIFGTEEIDSTPGYIIYDFILRLE